jgi:hypothetical protein
VLLKQLEKHSIENYLLDYSGMRALVLADLPRANIDECLSISDYEEIISGVSNSLRPLFACFLSMAIHNSSLKSCSYKPGHFQVQNVTCSIDSIKVEEFIRNADVSVPANVCDYFRGDKYLDRGHGKYLLHYIWIEVRNKTRIGKQSNDRLLIRLAQLTNMDALRPICESIIEAVTRNCS